MKEAKDPKSAVNTSSKGSEGRDAEATSSETLSDVEKTQSTSKGEKSPTAERSSGGRSPVPSPDGTPIGDRGGRADGSDTGGPM
jgi:hypothetical protein